MRPHVKKRGRTYSIVIERGMRDAQRCAACKKRQWVRGKPLVTCPSCGGEMKAPGKERRQQWVTTPHTKKREAENYAATLIAKLERGEDPFPEDITFRDYAEQWLSSQAQRVRPTTLARYRHLLETDIYPVLGDRRLDRIKPAHVQNVIDGMTARGLKPRTVIQGRAVMSSAMRGAVRGGLIAVNPVSAVTPPKPARPQLAVPNWEEVARLMTASGGTPWEVPLLLAASTGARRSEVLGLAWSGVDFERGVVHITRGLQRVPGPDGTRVFEFFEPKSERSRRTFKVAPSVLERLRRHRREQMERLLMIGQAWDEGGLVCDRGDGEPIDPDTLGQAFKRLAKRAGLPPGVRLHDLRHAFATTLFEQDVHPVVVSAVLGHSSVAFTQSVYTHLREERTQQAADVMERALGGGA